MTVFDTHRPSRGVAMVLAAAALVAVVGGAAPSAQAQNHYGCACLHNKVGVPIKYRYHWGDGAWHAVEISANHMRWMCWNYGTGAHTSPPLQFQLDVDMTGGTRWTTYRIERIQSRAQDCNVIPSHGHYEVHYRPGTSNREIHITRRP